MYIAETTSQRGLEKAQHDLRHFFKNSHSFEETVWNKD